jgi:hypothetical protein
MQTLRKQLSILIGCILRSLCSSTLQCNSVSLVLETLWGDESLNLGSFGVWLFAFTLWLNFSSNDEFANMEVNTRPLYYNSYRFGGPYRTSSFLSRPKNLRILVARLGPSRFGWTTSVKPGMSPSPCLTMESASTDRSCATMQPRTDLRLRSPVRRGR